MQSDFWVHLQLGFQHIADIKAYDHILFLVALCAVYSLQHWKRVLVLVTAFTVGHSLTLIIAGLDIWRLPAAWVEVLIPASIIATVIVQLLRPKVTTSSYGLYILALCFGLIHGLGFSNFFRQLLFPGEEPQLVVKLLAFNIGVELGQLLIVAIILLLASLVQKTLLPERDWRYFVSGTAFGLALVMMLERIGEVL